MNDLNKLSHTTLNCKYHIVFAPKYRLKVFYGQRHYDVDTVGKNTQKIAEYIQDQLKEGVISDELPMDLDDPFTGKQVTNSTNQTAK